MQLSVQLVCTALRDLTSPSAVLLVTTPIARACLAATSVLMGETVWFLMPYYEFTQFSSVLGGGCKSIWNVICAPPNLCWKLSCWKSFCVCLMDSGSILPSLSRSIDHWLLLFFLCLILLNGIIYLNISKLHLSPTPRNFEIWHSELDHVTIFSRCL